MMTTKELERKYDLHLGDFTFDSSDYWSWKVEHRARPIEFWADVSKDPNLTYNFIKLYKEFLYWDVLVYDKFYQDINFVREFWNRIDCCCNIFQNTISNSMAVRIVNLFKEINIRHYTAQG